MTPRTVIALIAAGALLLPAARRAQGQEKGAVTLAVDGDNVRLNRQRWLGRWGAPKGFLAVLQGLACRFDLLRLPRRGTPGRHGSLPKWTGISFKKSCRLGIIAFFKRANESRRCHHG